MLHFETVSDRLLEILTGCMRSPALDGFFLAGGTSLALRMGHRISIDIDLFGSGDVHSPEILQTLMELGPVMLLKQSPNIRISSIDGVKVDLVNYGYPLIAPPDVVEGMRLISLPDLASMKLNAIAGRGSRKDFIDLFFLLQTFSLDEMLAFYQAKYSDGNPFLIRKSLSYFDDAEREAMPVMLAPVAWPEIKEAILRSSGERG